MFYFHKILQGPLSPQTSTCGTAFLQQKAGEDDIAYRVSQVLQKQVLFVKYKNTLSLQQSCTA